MVPQGGRAGRRAGDLGIGAAGDLLRLDRDLAVLIVSAEPRGYTLVPVCALCARGCPNVEGWQTNVFLRGAGCSPTTYSRTFEWRRRCAESAPSPTRCWRRNFESHIHGTEEGRPSREIARNRLRVSSECTSPPYFEKVAHFCAGLSCVLASRYDHRG
jgi:hypothetical protein